MTTCVPWSLKINFENQILVTRHRVPRQAGGANLREPMPTRHAWLGQRLPATSPSSPGTPHPASRRRWRVWSSGEQAPAGVAALEGKPGERLELTSQLDPAKEKTTCEQDRPSSSSSVLRGPGRWWLPYPAELLRRRWLAGGLPSSGVRESWSASEKDVSREAMLTVASSLTA